MLFCTGFAWTIPGETLGSTNGIGNIARFNHPESITTDGKSLYIADGASMKVRKMKSP